VDLINAGIIDPTKVVRTALVDAAGVASLAKLHSVTLTNNHIGAKGAEALAGVAANWRGFLLGNNKVGDNGAAALAAALNNTKSAGVLELQGNGITDAGANSIAKALSSAIALSNVNLSNNQIGTAGALALKSAFANSSQLDNVDLSANSDGLVSGPGLAELVSSNGIVFPHLSLARAGSK